MSAATPRTVSTAPELRPLLVAVGTLILAVALLVAVAIGRQATFQSVSSMAGNSAATAHDHGWSSVSTGSQDIVVSGTAGGGIRYTGIPYPAPAADGTGGSNGTRFAQ